MAEQVILQALGRSAEGERIHDEFERRTVLATDVRDDGRYYELRDDQQRTRIVRTLTDITAGWTDHVGFKLPA